MATRQKKSPKVSQPCASRNKVGAAWRKLFSLIPGYDPVATAGGCWFDAETANKAIRFFAEHLTHIEGDLAGQPLELADWQKAIVACAFGWKRPDGTRRYREVFQYVPRKNGKTTLCGGLINLVGFLDSEPGAQIYSAAAEKEQAALVHRQAKGMILNREDLASGTKLYATMKSIEYPGGAIYKALSADADTKHGFNSHFVIADELHAHRNRDLLDVLMTSTGSRRQPMVWIITTADFMRPSICNEKYEYACKVRDGIIKDESFLPVIYECKADDDWKSPAVWAKANPNLGESVRLDYLERECARAIELPSYENTFKRLHLNLRTEQDVRWMPIETWDASSFGSVNLDTLRGRECWGGLDLSTTTDIGALVLVFPIESGGADVLCRFWVPEEGAELRSRRDRVPYLEWIKRGLMTATEGNVTDYDVIRRDINQLREEFNIQGIAIDRWNATQLSTQLMGDGCNVVAFGQGFASMSAPFKELEKLVLGKQLHHGGNEVLRWMASNVAAETDAAGNVKPSKKKSTGRIDGIVSLTMAIGLASSREVTGGSVYDNKDAARMAAGAW